MATLAFLFLWTIGAAGLSAQPIPPHLLAAGSSSEAATAIAVPPDLRPEQVDAFVAPLSDREARTLLLTELHAKTTAMAAISTRSGLKNSFAALLNERRAVTAMLGDNLAALGNAWIILPGRLDFMLSLLINESSFAWGLIGLAIMTSAGAFAAWGVGRLTAPAVQRWTKSSVEVSWPVRAALLFAKLLVDLIGVVVLVFVASAFSFVLFSNDDPMRFFAETYASVFAVAWAAYVVASFLFAPKSPGLRLVMLDDRTAKRATSLVVQIATIVGMMKLNQGFLELLGADIATITLFSIPVACIGILAFALYLLTARVSGDAPALLKAWPWLCLLVLVIVGTLWLTNMVLAERREAISSVIGFILFMTVPTASTVLSTVFPAYGEADSIGRLVAMGLQRLLLCLLVLMSLALLLQGAGLPLYSLLDTPVGAAIWNGLVELVVIGVVSAAIWTLLRDWIDRWIERERETALANADLTGMGEGEGGTAIIGTRVQTLLPLFRATMLVLIVAVASLMVLSSIGIDIGPLLAGAGVIGLAIGFGAQALVRDVVSGIFFLIDDAFRVGEYLEIDTLRGEVEKISVRSMQLRHHRGMVQTIPFGELRHITNYSRDWVIYKQDFLVPFETDIEKVRKLIKKLGQQLMQHPDYGHMFIEPLKSQGVTRIEEAGMVVRTKFTCKPRQQFLLRRYVNLHIQRIFMENGIQFARRRIQVEAQGGEIDDSRAASAAQAVLEAERQTAGASGPAPR